MKAEFAAAGLSDIPVSTSELAFGWQSSGNITAMVDAVDFFMITVFFISLATRAFHVK